MTLNTDLVLTADSGFLQNIALAGFILHEESPAPSLLLQRQHEQHPCVLNEDALYAHAC